MKRVVLSLIAAAVVAAPEADARACTPPQDGSPHTVIASMQATDSVPPTLPAIPPATVQRFDETGSGCGGGCPATGTVSIAAVATDDMTAPDQIGYRFTLASGTLPDGFTLPSFAKDPAGTSVILRWDGDGDLDVTLQVVAIDLAGNESTPQTVSVRDDSGACAVAGKKASRPALAFVALLALLAVTNRRRRP